MSDSKYEWDDDLTPEQVAELEAQVKAMHKAEANGEVVGH